MSPRTATAAAPDFAAPTAEPMVGFHEVPLRYLLESKLNPRKRVTQLDELAASIREVGILEPLLVRPHAVDGVNSACYEVVAGGRRFAAAQMAGVVTVPVHIRQLTDAQALELAIVENNQRGDVHPLEEAEAFAHLKQLDGHYTPEAIAARIGRPVAYVKGRQRLLDLTKSAREAFLADELTLGHAQLLAKLTPDLQAKALKQGVCVDTEFDYETGKGSRIVGPARLSRLQDFINEQVRLDLAEPEAQEEFPELAADVAKATAAGATVLMLADVWGNGQPKKPGDPLDKDQVEEVKKGTKGAQLGVFVIGRRRGKSIWVTLKPERKAPPRATSAPRTAKQTENDKKARAAEAKRQADEKAKRERQVLVVSRAVVEVSKKATAALLTKPAALRVLCGLVVDHDTFDQQVLDELAKSIRVPRDVFSYNGKPRAALAPAALVKVLAVLTIGAVTGGGHFHGEYAETFKAFGVDLKAIDRAVQKELEAAAKATTTATPAGRKAAKKR